MVTEGLRPGEHIISEPFGQRARENIVIASGQGVLPPGRVVGKITASGKYGNYASGASDGRETVVGVLLAGVDATSADVKAVDYQYIDAMISTSVGGDLAGAKTALEALGCKLR